MLEKGIDVTVINARFVKPFDETLIKELISANKVIVTIEENVKTGGFGQIIGNFLIEQSYSGKFLPISLPDAFIEHGSVTLLRKKYGLDAESVAEKIWREVQFYFKEKYKLDEKM